MKKRQRFKNKKFHLYLGNAEPTQEGYSKTACGKDGYYVGGFIFDFFVTTKVVKRCKTCNKIFKRVKSEYPTNT